MSGPKTEEATEEAAVTVGFECPKAFTAALRQLAKTEGQSFDGLFAQAVALKIKQHGGVAALRQTYGGGRPVKIVVFPEGAIPEEAIDVFLK